MDYSQTLEREQDVTVEQIQEAHRTQALQDHPGRNNGAPHRLKAVADCGNEALFLAHFQYVDGLLTLPRQSMIRQS